MIHENPLPHFDRGRAYYLFAVIILNISFEMKINSNGIINLTKYLFKRVLGICTTFKLKRYCGPLN